MFAHWSQGDWRMSLLAHRGVWLVAVAAGLAAITVGTASLHADTPAGHTIADRFASDADKAKAAKAARAKSDAEKARRDAAQRRIDEQDMIADARAEAEARRAEQDRERALTERAEIDHRITTDRARDARAAEQRRHDEQRRVAAETAEQERAAALVAEREAEGRRIADKLRQAEADRADREQRRVEQRRDQIATVSPHRSATVELREPTRHPSYGYSAREERRHDISPTRVTVLLLLEPGNRGIRRHNKTADPVLCSDDGCWISDGPAQPAYLLPRRKALGFGRTWGGERAGACSNSLGCVFRNVELGPLPATLQPVDMRLVRHDRREPQRIDAASQCRIHAGALQCRTGHHGGDYVMWVIPEALAAEAGPALLERALDDGLPERARVSLAPAYGRR